MQHQVRQARVIDAHADFHVRHRARIGDADDKIRGEIVKDSAVPCPNVTERLQRPQAVLEFDAQPKADRKVVWVRDAHAVAPRLQRRKIVAPILHHAARRIDAAVFVVIRGRRPGAAPDINVQRARRRRLRGAFVRHVNEHVRDAGRHIHTGVTPFEGANREQHAAAGRVRVLLRLDQADDAVHAAGVEWRVVHHHELP